MSKHYQITCDAQYKMKYTVKPLSIPHRHKGRPKNVSTHSKHRRSVVNFTSLALKSVGKKSFAHLTRSRVGPRVGPRAGLDILERTEIFSPLLNTNIKFAL